MSVRLAKAGVLSGLLIIGLNLEAQTPEQKMAAIDAIVAARTSADYYTRVIYTDSTDAVPIHFFPGDSSTYEIVDGYYLLGELERLDAMGHCLLPDAQAEYYVQLIFDKNKLVYLEGKFFLELRKSPRDNPWAGIIYKSYFEADTSFYSTLEKTENGHSFDPKFYDPDINQLLEAIGPLRKQLEEVLEKEKPGYLAAHQKPDFLESIAINWVSELPGNFSFAKKHSMACEAWCYEYAGANELTAIRTDDRIDCYTHCDAATHCSLQFSIAGDKVRNVRIELTSVVQDGNRTYRLKSGQMTIDQYAYRKGILKAEFDFTFYHPENPDQEMFWRGRIRTKIQ